ncbi:helix-turn-helix domain-containing protein [Goodfellowiella coeruleoviolacea]|uniref:Helix-turn-helix domain-containing protein n=1 Tax=Goodfellowiella coeruleoviolacea TaxID=334858 RepID=A0AAE3GEB9_9PSEU|nr:helix-turn-helix transcriptional regulator [Goodfellowiella coeruleoviolacea]MCP2164563.1 Helix-turn-helix domain-containing protein [Goodfellowiella coeruleoviolacea]
MASLDKRRVEFGDRLRHLRDQAGMSGRRLAEALGWAPSKISKLETGKQLATDSDVIEWCRATGAPESVREELRDALRDLKVSYETWRSQLRDGGFRSRQQQSADIEKTATKIRAVEFGVVPGLVQIPEYAREVFAIHSDLLGLDRDLDEAVSVRMARQQVLYEPGKQIEILVAESALRYPVASASVMLAQIDRLISIIGIRSIRLGIIPLNRRLPIMPMHGYWVVDDLVLTETIVAEIKSTEPSEVEAYNKLTDQLWTVAVEDAEARALLHQIANDTSTFS